MLTPPYIAFSLEPPCESITVQTLAGPVRIARGEPFSRTVSSLEIMNELGLDAAALMIGKHVLATLNLWHPEAFRQFPNLQMPHPDDLKHLMPKLQDGNEA